MKTADLLLKIASNSNKPLTAQDFCDVFLNSIGVAESELYDPDTQPELDTLFDECVRYQDLLESDNLDNSKKELLEKEIANIVFNESGGTLLLDRSRFT